MSTGERVFWVALFSLFITGLVAGAIVSMQKLRKVVDRKEDSDGEQ